MLGCFPATGGKSGAVLAIACTPGFSSTDTVITLSVAAAEVGGSFWLAILENDQDVAHLAFKRGITPLQVIGHLVRLQGLIGENALHGCF